MSRWFVLWIMSGCEMALLEQARIIHGVQDAIVPRGMLWTRKEGQWHEHETIYFPGYLFVRCEMSGGLYYALRGLKGVIGWLGMDPVWPSSVPEDEMAHVIALADGDLSGLNLIVNKRQRRAYGQMVLMGTNHKIALGYMDKQTDAGEVDASPSQADVEQMDMN